MRNITCLFLILLLLLSVFGCKKEQVAVKKPTAEKVTPAEKKEMKKGAEEAAVEQKEYKYDAKGRRDPFLSIVMPKQKLVKRKGASPIESYDIDEIRLLAIAWDKNKYYALIMLPDKKTYTIREGMTLGLQGGKAVKITKDTVTIREFVANYKGEIKPRDTILKLHKGEEG